MPFDREKDRRITEDTEVVGAVGVLPDVLAVDHQEFANGLLQAGMEFIAKAGLQLRCRARRAAQKRVQHVRTASDAGERQVLIKGSLQGTRI